MDTEILPLPRLNDEELVTRLRAGETALFELLMRRHNQKLYRIARGMNIPDLDADDLIQQAYIQCYQKLGQFKGESAFSTWLVRIMINECLMFTRKRRPVVSEAGLLSGFDSEEVQSDPEQRTVQGTPETEMIKKELRTIVEKAIEQLPEDLRIVYVMRETEEMSTREIAECLSLTQANVKVRLHRARKLLHASLKHYLKPTEIYEFGASRCDRLVYRVISLIGV